MRYFLLFFCFLVFFNWPTVDAQQRELLFGTSSSPTSLDTLFGTTVDSATAISRQVTFKGPLTGFVAVYGKKTALTGSDTSLTVYYRSLGSRYDSPAIFSQYDSLTTIADGDSTFFISVYTPSTWKVPDGIEFKFVMDTAGTRSIKLQSILKLQ